MMRTCRTYQWSGFSLLEGRHPLMPKDIKIYGFIMDSTTGELSEVPETGEQ